MTGPRESSEAPACGNADCDRTLVVADGALVCCISCAMSWATRTAPVHINRCDVAHGKDRSAER